MPHSAADGKGAKREKSVKLLLSSPEVNEDAEQADKSEQGAQNKVRKINLDSCSDEARQGTQPYLTPLQPNVRGARINPQEHRVILCRLNAFQLDKMRSDSPISVTICRL